MYRFEGLGLAKMMSHEADILRDLKAESWSNTHRVTICNKDDQTKWFDSLDQNVHSPRELFLMAFEYEDNDPRMNQERVGVFKINNADYINRSADVGWDIFKRYRRKGYGRKIVRAGVSFCFEILNLHRLNAEILSFNVASIKCAESARFQKEGTKREAVIKKGQYVDSFVFGLLGRDFK